MRKPIVIVPADVRAIGSHPYHAAQMKYIDAVVLGAGCVPLVLPALGAATDLDAVLAVCDGILLTGSASNVGPQYFGQTVHNAALPLDPRRDATTLPLIRAAIARAMPLFGICRGFQEINVALGGTLLQAVQEVPGMLDHRDDPADALAVQYGPAHPIALTEGGLLERLLGAPSIDVNSLHGQGIDRLADGLVVEARAPDGLIEAVSLAQAAAFVLAVQWHPEWDVEANAASMAMFGAFGQACRAHQRSRT